MPLAVRCGFGLNVTRRKICCQHTVRGSLHTLTKLQKSPFVFKNRRLMGSIKRNAPMGGRLQNDTGINTQLHSAEGVELLRRRSENSVQMFFPDVEEQSMFKLHRQPRPFMDVIILLDSQSRTFIQSDC